MAQWSSQGLLRLAMVLWGSVLVISVSAYFLPPSFLKFPFDLTENGYRLTMGDISMFQFPISIESLPYVNETGFVSVRCGEEYVIQEKLVSFDAPVYLGVLSICSNIDIDVWPHQSKSGLWIRGQIPLFHVLLIIYRLCAATAVGVTFMELFNRKKNFTAMRSALIYQLCGFFMIDPLLILQAYVPSVEKLHVIIFCLSWWRSATEMFQEYGPLFRGNMLVFKVLSGVQIASVLFIGFLKGIYADGVLFGQSFLFSLIMPILGLVFSIRIGDTTGKFALGFHLAVGVSVHTILFLLLTAQGLFRDLRDSVFIDVVNITVSLVFVLCQTLFHAGEDEHGKLEVLGHGARKFDKIDEALDDLVADESIIDFSR